MGDRGTVEIHGVYLYTHWGASDLIDVVRKALAKKWRWDDQIYLARIIFDTMLEGCHGTETGFGIMTEPIDEWRCIHVDCNKQRVIVVDNGKENINETLSCVSKTCVSI